MTVEFNEISSKSNGGTELMARKLEAALPPELLEQVQIIPSRVRELDETKCRILWLHDLPSDPESEHLRDEGWKKFHKIVCVSYTQRDAYMREYNIPFSRMVVLHNAIDPIDVGEKPTDKVRLIYHTTPHRGLEILVPVFEELQKHHNNLHLDVFSSFEIYGWKERDKPYQELYERIKANPDMTYHGYQPQEVVRKALAQAHIFAYPSIWVETSCLSLMEAMSAKCYCVHSDLGALPETAANWTLMYNMNENLNHHASTFYGMLNHTIDLVNNPDSAFGTKLSGQKSYVDFIYNWEIRAAQWHSLISGLVTLPREFEKVSGPMFTYRTS